MGKVVAFKRPDAEKAIEQIVQLDALTNGELVRLVVEATEALKARSQQLPGLTMHDHEGRLWSMTSIMRHIGRQIDWVNTVVGVGRIR